MTLPTSPQPSFPSAARPLDGITVISLEHAIAAPFCTRQLADLGARVIKVERPGVGDFARAYDQRVDGLASHFVWVNRSKESLTLDLKQPGALAVLKQLIATADVLVQNLAPGAAARMGLGYAELAAAHPALIVCDISGYGDDPARPGPYRDKKAYDLLIQSEAGFLSVTGTPDAPSKAGNSIADIAAGMYAYTSILAALLQRDKRGGTGKGAHIDVSMLESLTEWMGYPMYYAYQGATPPPRNAASHATIYPYGPFAAGDGGTVMLGLQNEREWKQFCERVLQDAALATDPRFDSNAHRNAHREALQQHLTAEGIGTLIHYPVPPHRQEAFAHLNMPAGQFPIAEALAATCLSLPMWPGMQKEQVKAVSDSIRRFSGFSS